MKQVKQDMINDHSEFKKFRVVENFEDKIMHEFMSWIRFVEFDENIALIYQYQSAAIQKAQKYRDDSDSDDDDPAKGFKAKDLPPLSIRNEKKVLQRIIKEAKEILEKYPRTLEEDLKLLERTDLTFNHSNCLLYTSGEKVILNFLINTSQKILPLLDMDFKVTLININGNIDRKKDSIERCFIGFFKRLYHECNFLPHKERQRAKPGDKKGAQQQIIDDDYSDLPTLPPLNNYIFLTMPAFKYKKNLQGVYQHTLKHYIFPPEDTINNQKIKVIQREDIINYAKLKQYITEEESLDLANKLSQERIIEIMAKTTNDLILSFEVPLRRTKKDQQPPSDNNHDTDITIWLKDFPQSSAEFKAFYSFQIQQTNPAQPTNPPVIIPYKPQIHSLFILEELFLQQDEDEEILKFSSPDPTMNRYYQEEERKRIEEKKKIEFFAEERVQTFQTALDIAKMFQTSQDAETRLGTVHRLKFQGQDPPGEWEEDPISKEMADSAFSQFALQIKQQQEESARDLQQYRSLRKEYLSSIQPRPLMPFPEDPERKKREEEERRLEQLRKQEEERKAQEQLLLQQQQAAAAQKKGAPPAKNQAAANQKSRENLHSSQQQRALSQQALLDEEERKKKMKKEIRSRDDEDKEWNFQQFEKVMAELSTENGSIGSLLAAMVYQIQQSQNAKKLLDPKSLVSENDKQFILQSEEQETALNDYFDDIFNKLAIEHNVLETTFKHQVHENPIIAGKKAAQSGSTYQSLFNENDKVSQLTQAYSFLNGDPISLCENKTLQNSQIPGINNRIAMPSQPTIQQPQRESDLAAVLSFSSLPTSQAKRCLILRQCEQMFKQAHPEREFNFLDRNFVEKFDATTLRQVLAQTMRLKPDIVTKYVQSEDALILGVYFKNPPGRLLRRQWTYPLKVFPDYQIWQRFIKHQQWTPSNDLLDIDPSKVGFLRSTTKYSFPCDNSIIRVDKHHVGNRILGTSLIIKDNLVFGVKENNDKFKAKNGYYEDELLNREAWAQSDRKCTFWLEFENGTKLLVEMQDRQQARLEEIPLQEPLPPKEEKEAPSTLSIKHGGDEVGDSVDKQPEHVQSPVSGQGQAKTMVKNASQKSVGQGAAGKQSQMAKPPAPNANQSALNKGAAAPQTNQQPLQKSDSQKSLDSQSSANQLSPQEIAMLQKKRDEEERLMTATSKMQFFQDKYDPTVGAKMTFTFNEGRGLIVQIMPNGDCSQSLVENPQEKKKYGGTLQEDPLPANLHEKSRLITRNGQVIRYFLDGNLQIFYPDGTITTTDKRKGAWFTVNTKGVKRVRKLQDNQVYDEPRRLKINEKVDPETSAVIQVREDGVLVIKYIDERRLVMFPDGTQILTTKNPESTNGTITLITKEGYAPVRQIYDAVKARAKSVIGLGGTDALIGIEKIMERSNNGKVTEVLLPDKTVVQSYQERQELEGYNNFMTNMVHLIKRDDFSIIKVRQDGEVVLVSANQRAYLNSIGKQRNFGVNDYDYFFELFGIPTERRSGVYTANLDQGKLTTQDEEGNVFIIYANGDSVEKLSVSFNLDQMVEGIERKEPEEPNIKDGEYIEEECKFLPPPKTIAHPRLFLIKNDQGYEFFNQDQLSYLFRVLQKDKDLILTKKPLKIDNEEAHSHLWMRKTKKFDPLAYFGMSDFMPKIPQSVELINQTVSIPLDPVQEEFIWRNIIEYKALDKQQVEDFNNALTRHQNMRKKQTEEKERLKVVEVKSEEHREMECKIWLRIARERNIDVTQVIGDEYKPLKEIVNDEKKQKFLEDLDDNFFTDDEEENNK